MSIFWSSWITILSIACWLFILGVLLFTLRLKPKLDEDGTTGHTYDDVIKEYDKPLPKWWLGVFFGTIVWGIGYWIFFPALMPHTFNGIATVTVDGKEVPWSSHNELASDLESNNNIFTENFRTNFLPNEQANQKLASLASLQSEQRNNPDSASDLQGDINTQIKALAPYVEELNNNSKALMAGERLFLQNCSLCHGSNAQGAKGYPDLTDNDWLHGGEPENILLTIHNGRHVDYNVEELGLPMAAWRDTIGEDGVRAAAEYVLSISTDPKNPEDRKNLDQTLVNQGQAIFEQNCTACHGQDATGSTAAGAPNLTDGIWLFGGDRETVRETIRNGRMGVMPEWETKLGNERIMLLAAYVYSLTNNGTDSAPMQETASAEAQ